MAGLHVPLSTLHPGPHGPRRMTRGQSDWLGLTLYSSFICDSLPVSGAFPFPQSVFHFEFNFNFGGSAGAGESLFGCENAFGRGSRRGEFRS